MTGNRFAPEAVARAVELIKAGAVDLRATIRREFPTLTEIGIDRVIDIARGQVIEREAAQAGKRPRARPAHAAKPGKRPGGARSWMVLGRASYDLSPPTNELTG